MRREVNGRGKNPGVIRPARGFLLAAALAVAVAALGQFMIYRVGAQGRGGAKKVTPPVDVLKKPSVPGTQSVAPTGGEQKAEPVAPGRRKAPIVVDPMPPQPTAGAGTVYTPTAQPVASFPAVNVRKAATEEALNPGAIDGPTELRPVHAPKGDKPETEGLPIPENLNSQPPSEIDPLAPPASATGSSPGPTKTFKGEFLSATNIPPDTMGAVGTTHVVTVSNNQMNVRTRDGELLQRMTLTAFWSGVTIKGAAVSAFDPKVLYDRFNQRWIFVASFNGQSINSGAGVAVSQTNDPTGLWHRYAITADPTSTATGGLWIDYPSLGHNKNWIILNENTFGYGTVSGYQRADIFVLDKAAAYAGTLGTISAFQASTSTCTSPGTQTKLGCGFTMSPTVVEDNTTEEAYLVEDWNSTSGQLRVSKLTGTAAAPVLTVGTQFPQSTFSWKFNANRVNGAAGSGGYAPQRQTFSYAPSGTRIMTNDSRIQNAVLRNGFLWATHTVMVAATPTPAGTGYSTLNPDVRSAVQWWQIDPAVETGLTNPPVQRARIEDPTADNCNSSNTQSGNSLERAGCTAANQVGTFFAYPSISVNQSNDVLIGFSQFSAFTYPNGAYAIRRSTDSPNTTRDPVVFRAGQANYNLQANTTGTTPGLQTRWGDYSASQTDPLDDTKFWTVQEYGGTYRNDFVVGTLRSPWETWWAQVDPAAPQPSKTANLIISEFRLRGPQGAQDEFIELYNPNAEPVIVNTTDNSDGWAVGFDSGTTQPGLAVIPNGTVVPPLGHYLVANNPDSTDGPTITYSLNAYPALPGVRGSDSDVGYHVDIADNQGVALFRTATRANFAAATRADAAGFSTLPAASLFKEGNGIPAITVQPTSNFSYYRSRCPGNTPAYGSALGCSSAGPGTPKDSNANENDFVYVDTDGLIPTPGIQRLGAPGPQNLDSPLIRNNAFVSHMFDATVGGSSPPNRVRSFSPGPDNTSIFGTLAIRRRLVNNTGVPVTRLRFRVNDITTYPAPAGFADLRAVTSTDVTVNDVQDAGTCASAGLSAPCSITVRGTTLEEPPIQVNGGGFNSTLSAGVITLASPLAPGASVSVQFMLGIQQTGNFRFFVNIEALP